MQKEVNLRKTLTVYYLVDTGAQMAGDKIGLVNSAMEEAIAVDLPDISTANDDAEIRVAIIQFSDGASWVTPGSVSIGDVIWNDLHASGANDFGKALRLLAEDLKFFDPQTNFAPIVVAFSNATVTDEYTEILKQLSQMECFRKGCRLGIAIGSDADKKALEAFIGSSGAVLPVNDKHTMKALMRKTAVETKPMIDLKTILNQHPNCLISRATLRSYLLDMFPSNKKSANILASIHECGISQKIQYMKILTEHDVQTFVNQLDREYGIAPKYATEYIYVWADAYDVKRTNMPDYVPVNHSQFINGDGLSSLVEYFEANGFEVIDKRKVGGCLWVVGEKTKLNPFVERAKELFSITDGGYAKGRATGGRHGWYTTSKK